MQDGARHTRFSQTFCTGIIKRIFDMAYFPFFFELRNKQILIIGGGKVALEKVERLKDFGAFIHVIAPDILLEIKKIENISFENRKYAPGDILGADFVIAATDIEEVNEEICELCRENRIPINVVDDKDKCDFIFPSVVKRGELVAGITSSGASPQVAIRLRKEFENLIPDNIEDILDYLGSIREDIKKSVPDAKKRHKVFKLAADVALEKGRALTKEEIKEIVNEL